MTNTIQIDRAVVVELFEFFTQFPFPTKFYTALQAALQSKAAAEPVDNFPVNWATMLHYPECWDTAVYPNLRDAIHEALAWYGCSVCESGVSMPHAIPIGWVLVPKEPGDWIFSDKVIGCDATADYKKQHAPRISRHEHADIERLLQAPRPAK